MNIYSETQFYTEIKRSGDKVQLKNDDDQFIVVPTDYLDKCLVSADSFTKEEKVTRTELAEKFLGATRMAITVCYNKQVKATDIKSELSALEGLSGKTFNAAVSKLSKSLMEGEERIMKGRHYGHLNEFGRVDFVDMEQEKGVGAFDARLRQVDPRTIKWVIINGVKYIQK